MTVRELLTEWYQEYLPRTVCESTYIRNGLVVFGRIQRHRFGKKDIKEVGKKEAQEYVTYLLRAKNRTKPGEKLKPRSIIVEIKTLHAAFAYARRCGYIDTNPWDKVKRPKIPRQDILLRCFQIQEQKKIEKACFEWDNASGYAILFALYTGARIGEVCALAWDDIDFEGQVFSINKTAHVRYTKDGSEKYASSTKSEYSNRMLPINGPVLEILTKLYEQRPEDAPLNVFPQKNGSMMTVRYLEYKFRKLRDGLDISELTFHSLRHTFATRAMERNVDIFTLSRILGHATPSFTLKVYGHSTVEHKHEMMNLFERMGNKP